MTSLSTSKPSGYTKISSSRKMSGDAPRAIASYDALPLVLASRLRLSHLMRALQGRGLAIVSYHGVVPDDLWRDWETADLVAESVFREHLEFYRNAYHVLSLREAVLALSSEKDNLPYRSLAITFDDGYKNNLLYALPALKEYGLTATFFLTTGFLDGTVDLWWLPIKRFVLLCARQQRPVELPNLGKWPAGSRDEAGGSYRMVLEKMKKLNADARTEVVKAAERKLQRDPDPLKAVYAPLNWDEARIFLKEGMEVGAHSVSHPILAKESDEKIRLEIRKSVERIRRQLPVESIPFAYPDGQRQDCQERIEAAVAEAGCYAGLANFSGINRKDTNQYRLQRFPIGGHHTARRLELDLCGLRSVKARLSGMTGYSGGRKSVSYGG